MKLQGTPDSQNDIEKGKQVEVTLPGFKAYYKVKQSTCSGTNIRYWGKA